MVVNAGDTGVLLHLFLVNVASLRHEEEKVLKRWAFFLKAQYCHLTREYKNAYSILTTSPNAEGLNTNHHNSTLSMDVVFALPSGAAKPIMNEHRALP